MHPLLLVNYNAAVHHDRGGLAIVVGDLFMRSILPSLLIAQVIRICTNVDLTIVIILLIIILTLCAVSDVRGSLLDCEQWAPDSPHAQ